jgi:hypothetical protein
MAMMNKVNMSGNRDEEEEEKVLEEPKPKPKIIASFGILRMAKKIKGLAKCII